MYNSTIYDFLKINRKITNNRLSWSVICLIFLTLTNLSLAQGSQDFETQTVLTTSYADGSFTENGITYTYVHSRNAGFGTNEDNSITGKGLMFRRANEPSSLEWTIPNGIGTLTFDARKAFSGGEDNRKLEVLVNGTIVWTSPTFGTAGEDDTIHNFPITIDEEGSTTIKIQVAKPNGNKQITIDNISWTGYPTPCIVNIPDANFKAYLVGNTAINTNGDTEIQCDEASAFDGNINCPSSSISDLTGIEAFVNIKRLRCQQNQLTSLNVSNNTALTELLCFGNQIASLDVSSNTALTNLRCNNNQLTSLDVSSNTALTDLRCFTNQITSLDISNNTALTQFQCDSNQITSLDVSNNTALTNFSCNNNQITTLDVSNNTALTQLSFNLNQIASLDVSNHTALTTLRCSSNQLTSLDLSNNSALTQLICQNNSLLTSLSVKNGNNANVPMSGFLVTGNNNLTCIEVDDVDYSTDTWLFKDSWASFSEDCNPPCIVNIPDANFKNYLLNNSAINTNGDDEIQCDEATAFTGSIGCVGFNISDLTGIEAFINITELHCNINELTSLDVSNNTALTHFFCNDNQLTSLDISNNTALIYFGCGNNQLTSLDVTSNTALIDFTSQNNQLTSLDVTSNTALTRLICSTNQISTLDISNNILLETLWVQTNQLTSLDISNNTDLSYLNCSYNPLGSLNVSNNTALETLWCQNNQLTSLDVSNNTALETFLCPGNQLTSLDVSNNVALETLWVYNNQLTSLDVSNNTGLANFHCDNNQLESLDVSNNIALDDLRCYTNQLTNLDVSNNIALVNFQCYNNQLISLDVSNNVALTTLLCQGNQLTSLNVKNGNNTNIGNGGLRVNNNPDLTCIDVDDADWSTANWTTFIDAQTSFSEDCNPCVVNILDANFKAYLVGNTAINTNGDDEIQCDEASAFDGMIDCSNLNISDLTGIEAFVNVTQLRCNQNQLTSLDISNNIALTELWCFQNQLTSLNVNDNTALTTLRCRNNQINSLNTSNNLSLSYLDCGYNQISSLDISNNTYLANFICTQNQLTTLDVSNNTSLLYIDCNNNQLTTLDISNNTSLVTLLCAVNNLTSLDVSNNTAIMFLSCFNNQIESLDLSNNTALYSFQCQNNQIASLDVSNNTALTTFVCFGNQLTQLDVSNNTALATLWCLDNQIISLDVSNNTALNSFRCQNNLLTHLNIKNGNNANMPNANFFAYNNPNLYCIEVDDVDYSNTNWSDKKDAQACFSENCITPDFGSVTTTVCENSSFSLPTTSDNNINGVWSPVFDNQTTTTYTFKPNSGECANPTTLEIVIQENTLAPPTGQTSQNFTIGQTISDLVVNGSNLVWYSDENLTTTIPTTTELVHNTIYYVVSESGICKSSALEITAIDCTQVVSTPTGETSQNFTAGQTIADLVVSGTNLVWYSDENLTTTIPTTTELVHNTIYYVVSESGICKSSVLEIIAIDCTQVVSTPIGETSQNFTAGQTIADLVVGGTNLVWYSDENLTNILPTTTELVHNTTYYVVSENGICKSSALAITVTDCATVVSTPTGETNQEFTAGQTIADLVVNGDNLVFYNSTYSETFSLTEELVDNQIYYVVSQVGNCQSDPLIIIVTQVVSRTNFDIYEFRYHPNPVNDILHLSSNSRIESVTISNILGQQVNANLNSDNTILDMSNLPSGNYFVKVTIEDVSKTIKVIKN